MSIADKLIRIADNTPLVAAAVNAKKPGRNLFDVASGTGKNSGSYYDAANHWITNVNPVSHKEYVFVDITDLWQVLKDSGKNVTFSFDLRAAADGAVRLYTLGGYSISFNAGNIAATTQWTHVSVTVPNSAYYFRENDTNGDVCHLSWYGTYGTGVIPFVRNLQIEISDRETAYEPYKDPQLYAAALEKAAQIKGEMEILKEGSQHV